jgi:pSer/pThr/pTyr-binding forkhead associated (FHA) protein
MSQARLIVRKGPNPGMVFELSKEVSLIGRDVANDIAIGDPEVSRQHARLTRTPGGYVLEDLGSTNGSFVNGERLVAPRVLKTGDTLGFGETVNIEFDSGLSSEEESTLMGKAAPVPEEAATRLEQPPPFTPQSVPKPVMQTPPAQVAAPPPATPISPATPLEYEASDNRRWIMAGVGCFVLVIACGVTIFLMDLYAPDILYAPLRYLGF